MIDPTTIVFGSGFDLSALPLTKAELIDEAATYVEQRGAAARIYDRYYVDKPIVQGEDRITRLKHLRRLIRSRRNTK